MLEAYLTNIDVGADAFIPFASTSVIKGCTATKPSADTIDLNQCGVYMVSVNGTSSAATTIQLYKDGVAQPQAQSTGEALSFSTLVQVDHNNCGCACSSPTTLQIKNTTAATFTDCNIVVTKVC